MLDLWPFAVEASNFKEMWQERMVPVKDQICQYLMWRKSRPENKISPEVEEKVEAALQELFWKLVKLRVKPQNERMTVLIHGAANLHNLMFSYDELSGRPNQAKLVDFSRVAVSSPVVDVSYFLYSSVHPLLISEHYVALLQVSPAQARPASLNLLPLHCRHIITLIWKPSKALECTDTK